MTPNECFRSSARSVRNFQPANVPPGYRATNGRGRDGIEAIFVKRGDVIETNFYAMHRDRGIWGDDADEFRPERWEKSHPPWAFMAFNGGPRTCPAEQMVYAEAAYVVTRLAQQFAEIENWDPCEAWQEEMRLNFQSKNGVKVGMFVTK